MKHPKRILAWMLAIVLILLPMAGCSSSDNNINNTPDTAANDLDTDAQPAQGQSGQRVPEFEMENYGLHVAQDYEELSTLLNSIVNGESYSSAENVGIVDEFFSETTRPAYAGNYGERSNNTRVLPEGVSKADSAVLSDGYLYRVQDAEMTILEAKGADSSIVSTTTVTSSVEDYENYEETAQTVTVQGNYAAVMTYVYAWSTVEGDNGEWSSQTVSQTHMKLYDVTDKAAPKLLNDYVQDGSYYDAYLANGMLYLVTDYYVMNLDTENSDSFIPKTGAADAMVQIGADKILVNDQADSAQFMVISALSMETGTASDTMAVTGLFRPYFVAADTLYLCGWCYAMQQSEPYEENQYQVTDFYSHAITLVSAFTLTDGIQMAQTACVNGRLSDEDQMDFEGGYLRLGTMEESYTNRLFEDESMGFANLEMGEHSFSNEVHVLDSELKLVGKLTGLSDRCLTYYQRFIDNVGYVISYDSENPVYTLNLTDPTAPTMGENLSSNDPVEILMRYGDQLLGLTAGGKLQLLQFADSQLQTVAEASIGEDYTAVRYHLDSVLLENNAGYVVLPGNGVMHVYAVSADAITEVGGIELTVSEKTRVLCADGLLYITSDVGFTVVNAQNCETVAQVSVAVG